MAYHASFHHYNIYMNLVRSQKHWKTCMLYRDFKYCSCAGWLFLTRRDWYLWAGRMDARWGLLFFDRVLHATKFEVSIDSRCMTHYERGNFALAPVYAGNLHQCHGKFWGSSWEVAPLSWRPYLCLDYLTQAISLTFDVSKIKCQANYLQQIQTQTDLWLTGNIIASPHVSQSCFAKRSSYLTADAYLIERNICCASLTTPNIIL